MDRSVHTRVASGLGDVFRLTRLPFQTRMRGLDSRIPGPMGLPVVGVAPWLMRDPFGFMRECASKFGDVFRVPVPAWDLVMVTHPDLIREVFHDRGQRFGMPDVPERVRRVTGLGLPFLDGDEYEERRALYAPMFGKRYLAGLSGPIVEEITARLRRWERFCDTGQVVNLEHELAMVLLPAFLRNMMSVSLTDEQIARYDNDLRETLAVVASAIWTRRPPNPVPLPGVSSVTASGWRTFREVHRLIDERITGTDTHQDLLQVLVDARLRDGSPLPRRDMEFDMVGLIVAGYDTVVAAMSWMLALLPSNPDAQEKLYAEVDALGGAQPTAADLSRLTWAKACFDEAQRLQGHPFNARFAKTDTELAGYTIPAGAMVGGSMIVVHRDPRWWADPERFDPTHFTDKQQRAARPATAFIPFGTGPHQCVGRAMAYQNAQLLTALIFQRYRINLQPGW
ncbi:MAG TPA: cytochrome P450, partial [Pseudonocardia sp.]